MATIEYWIQLENRPWDTCPNNIDRISGKPIAVQPGDDPTHSISGKEWEENVSLKPVSGPDLKRTMFAPLRDGDGKVTDALILRRYKPPQQPDQSDAWTLADDRKVNPWDLNEPDPTDSGTMGTIPGPVIECNVGDTVEVHFRNRDMRNLIEARTIHIDFPFGGGFDFTLPAVPLPIEKRCHSLHPHGFVFQNTSDGAYPLTPPDVNQPVIGPPGPDESIAWSSVPVRAPGGTIVGFSGAFKQGDRVPPGGTFVYRWDTVGWPSTSGVWLYHDHSICDMDNIELGAIGIIVIHNTEDTAQEVDIRDPNDPTKLDPAFLPDGSPNGHPRNLICFPLPDLPIRPHDLEGLARLASNVPTGHHHALPTALPRHGGGGVHHGHEEEEPKEPEGGRKPVMERVLKRGDLLFELDEKFQAIRGICFLRYDPPPSKALYLQLYHTLQRGIGMMINGRTYMGNTPTLVAGRETRMRFGVVGMGSAINGVHTFHIHGHRWIVPGPQGNTPNAIQSSTQVQAVSQFEDTRIFGPANSFAFTIDGKSGSFMRAGGRFPDESLGEWHMHCHVVDHMMMGMMGSLLIVNGGDPAFPLPVGVPCEHEMEGMPPEPPEIPTAVTLKIEDFAFETGLKVKSGGTVTFKNNEASDDHSVVWDTPGSPANVPGMAAGTSSAPVTMPTVTSEKDFNFHCGIHPSMLGSIKVVP